MGFTKYGSGDILPEPEDMSVEASRRWTDEDNQELMAEIDDDKHIIRGTE